MDIAMAVTKLNEIADGKRATMGELLQDRGKTHGDYTEQAFRCQEIKKAFANGSANWGALTCYQIDALEMTAVKISRILEGNPNEPDHWRDIAGYATLVADRVSKKG